MAKISLYLTDKTLAALDVARDGPESLSGRAAFLVEAAAALAASSTPALPLKMWLALLDANNGGRHSYEKGAAAVVSTMIENVADADVAHLGISGEAVADRMAGLAWVEQFAVFEVVRRFWAGGQGGARKGEGLADMLTRLGARLEV